MKKYKTINGIAIAEMVEKKSKFIANVSPVSTEKEAISFIEKIRKQHFNATHNCFAYIIKDNVDIKRFSDDGEPSGTAGRPILDVLEGEGIKNAIAIVTRYYGGTLLGTGGLVRAYGRTAKEGIINARIVQMDTYHMIKIKSDYTLSAKVQYEISTNGHFIIDTIYTDEVEFNIYVQTSKTDELIKRLINITNNKLYIKKGKACFLKTIDGAICID